MEFPGLPSGSFLMGLIWPLGALYKNPIKNYGFKTLFFHRKTEGPGLKHYEKIGFSALAALAAPPYKALVRTLFRRAELI